MAVNLFQGVKQAIAHLNPHEVRDQAERSVRIGLHAASETGYLQMENFFVPIQLSPERRAELGSVIERAPNNAPGRYDVEIYSPELRAPSNGFAFSVANPERTVKQILKERHDISLALGRYVYPFRDPVAKRVIHTISKENALFSLATAIPDIIPFISLPWAAGEFASDSIILTANQIRLAFFLAAISDRPIGYREQKGEIASICVGAFGWRAIARELVGKIPMGGGLLPKAAIAYAGTRVVGLSLERYYRLGYHLTRDQRQAAYNEALERGKSVAGHLLDALRHRGVLRGNEGA